MEYQNYFSYHQETNRNGLFPVSCPFVCFFEYFVGADNSPTMERIFFMVR